MHPNQQTLERFYQAFAQLDAETMAACYAPDVVFEDEVFQLNGQREVGGMWRMLCTATQAKGRDVWRLEFSGIEAQYEGYLRWVSLLLTLPVMGYAALPVLNLGLGLVGSIAVCLAAALLVRFPAMEWLRWLGAHSIASST